MLCQWFHNPDGAEFKKHLPRVHDYLWVAEDGCKMQGYNGSQLWDTAFAVQAIASTGLAEEFAGCLRLAHEYIDRSQVQENTAGDYEKEWFRHVSKGAWPFSTRDHGWPISDCSSEGLKAALVLGAMDPKLYGAAIPFERLCDAVNVIMSYKNGSGGCATYELTRSYAWLEYLNPAETFGDIMIDYSYVECTSACIQALRSFTKHYPGHRTEEVNRAIGDMANYILSIQKPDGSWCARRHSSPPLPLLHLR